MSCDTRETDLQLMPCHLLFPLFWRKIVSTLGSASPVSKHSCSTNSSIKKDIYFEKLPINMLRHMKVSFHVSFLFSSWCWTGFLFHVRGRYIVGMSFTVPQLKENREPWKGNEMTKVEGRQYYAIYLVFQKKILDINFVSDLICFCLLSSSYRNIDSLSNTFFLFYLF